MKNDTVINLSNAPTDLGDCPKHLVFKLRLGSSTNRTNIQKRATGLSLVIVPVIWVLLLHLGPGFFGEKRVNSIGTGGEIKVMLAGGPEILREDVR